LDTRTSHVEMEVTFNKTDQVNNKHARDKRTKKTCPAHKVTHRPSSEQSVSQLVAAAVVRPRFPYYTYLHTTVSRMYLAHVIYSEYIKGSLAVRTRVLDSQIIPHHPQRPRSLDPIQSNLPTLLYLTSIYTLHSPRHTCIYCKELQ
jgi:hypothetical protein